MLISSVSNQESTSGNKGRLERGIIKKSNNQVKKHISQMTSDEVEFLEKSLKCIDAERIIYSGHLEQKDIFFKREYVVEILKSEKLKEMIVEYNETTRYGKVDRRVLLRELTGRDVSIKSEKGHNLKLANLCIVLSLDSCRLVTAYWNEIGDTHTTMNWNRYEEGLLIIK